MNLIIEIKKVKEEDINLLKIALHDYQHTMQFLIETMADTSKYAKEMSIATEAWYDLNKKTGARFPKETTKIKLSLHTAYVLISALFEYSRNNTSNVWEQNQCRKYIAIIDKQLPTALQLSIKNEKLCSIV